jgi:hypothetical protein
MSLILTTGEESKDQKPPKPGSWVLANVEESDPRLEELLDDGFEPFGVQMVMKMNKLMQQAEPGFIVFLKKKTPE